MEQQIQFCKTSDGAHLAFSTLGQGPPMIWPPYWVTHLEEEWEFPLVKSFFLNLATKYTIIRYDKHGCGLSDRDRTDFSLEKEVRDLESIIDHLNLDKFSLFGMSQAGPTAIAYAAKYPEFVSHLILFGTWPQGNVGAPPEVKAALCNLIRASWGLGSKTLADIFVPDSGKEVLDSFKKWQRKASTGEMAARLLETEEHINVTELLPKIQTPTLVLHRKGDRACSVQGGKDLAKLIPNARLILLEGIDHLPWAGDSKSVSKAILEFLGNEGVSGSEPLIEDTKEKKEFKRKLAAILSADVKGYSRLMNDDDIYTIETLKKYRQIMSDLITQHSGRVVDSPGDNLLAEFSSAVDAVESAVDIQKRLKKENEQLFENKRLEFRVGVNVGDIVKDEDRIYGNGVNVASRIEGLTDPGGVCISRNAYDHVKDKLELGFEYLGKHEVKNIKEPIQVYKVLLGSDSSATTLVKESLELPDKPSIAVLPFDNMSGDPSQEYFSDGLTEQIINGLCKVSNLFVIARNSSFAYKGRSVNIRQVGKELGVRYILEGSVQKAGDRVRITVQLIDTTTGYHLWSENYDRDLSDIFALQDEITLKIINAIQIKLTMGEQARLWEGQTTSIQAYDMHMRGSECFFRCNEKDNKQAQQFYKEAINIDENYAFACAMLGVTYIFDLLFRWSESPTQSFEQAEKCAEKTLALNDSLDLAYLLSGLIKVFKRQHDEAINEGQRAITLNPNGADAHALFGYILNMSGETDLAINSLKRAFRLNPIPLPHYYHVLAMAYRNNEQYEKAIEVSERGLRCYNDQFALYLTLAASYTFLDRTDEAHMAAEEVLRIDPNFSLEYFAMTMPYKHQETGDKFIEALRKAGLPD